MRSRIIVVSVLFLSMVMVDLMPVGSSEDIGFFSSGEIYSSSRSLSGGIGIGDTDRDGVNEVLVCTFEGNVITLEEDGDGFRSREIWREPEGDGLLDLHVGDVIPERSGVEVLVGGYSKDLTLIYYDGSEYVSEVIYTSPQQIFSISVGEFDPMYPGEEIFLASFEMGQTAAQADRTLRVLGRSGTGFVARDIALPDTPKAVEIADIDPSVPGNEAWVTTSGRGVEGNTKSSLLEVTNTGVVTERYRDDAYLIANIRSGDLYSGHAGDELIMVDFGGWCRMVHEEGGSYIVTDIFQAKGPTGNAALLEGLVVGEFNDMNEGPEALTTGYYNDVTQVVESDGEMVAGLAWATTVSDVFLELAGLAVGEFFADNPGNEVAIASRQGWVQMIYQESDGLDLEVGTATIEVRDGINETFQIEIVPRGSVTGAVEFDHNGGDGLTFYFPAVAITSHEPFTVTIGIRSDAGEQTSIPFILEASVGSYYSSISMVAQVSASSLLEIDPGTVRVYPDLNMGTKVTLDLQGSIQRTDLIVDGPEKVSLSGPSYLVLDTPTEFTLSVDRDMTPGTYPVYVRAMSSGEVVAQDTLLVQVVPLSEDLTIALDQISEDSYRVRLSYKGARMGSQITVSVLIGDDLQDTSSLVLDPDVPVQFEFDYHGEKDMDVTVTIAGTSGALGYSEVVGIVEGSPTDEEDGTLWVILLVIGLGLLAIAVVLLLVRSRPSPGEDASLQNIGGPTRYNLPRTERGSPRARAGPAGQADRPSRGRERYPAGRAREAPPIKKA